MNILDIKPNIVSKSVKGKYFLFYGDPSTRKTTVASQFPNALLLATEIGYSLIPGIHAAPVKSWPEFRDIIRQLKNEKTKETYETIVIDTVGLLTDMCMKYICDINDAKDLSAIPWGGGWTQFKKEFRTQINTIAQLGYGIVFIAHSDVKKDNETGRITSAVPTMDKKPRESVIALVDFIFFLQKEPKDENPSEITVYAYSHLQSAIESKSRARNLNPRFEFNFENLEKEISKAVDSLGTTENSIALVTEEEVNHHVESTSLSFEDLRTLVYNLALELTKNESDEIRVAATQQITAIMKGVRVSEATQTHYDSLETLKEALYEIKSTL